jgi:bacteriocin-like protein
LFCERQSLYDCYINYRNLIRYTQNEGQRKVEYHNPSIGSETNMSIPNGPKSERISINEKGEVVIHDAELASAVQELTDEELDSISGGGGNKGGNCGGGHCGTSLD